jgi:hypothetical protein
MAVTVKALIESTQAQASDVTQYVALNCTTIIDKFTATNTTGGAVTLSVNLVPSGSVAGANNLITNTKSIAAGEVYTFPELIGHTLNDGDFISTIASADTSLTIRASGREVT